jgi:23S rRNA pseudouridine1911/1915/1917 synthase
VPTRSDAFIGHSPREPGIVHRLDTDTSGALAVARTTAAFEELKAALKEGRLDKQYLLVCSGDGLPDDGTIELPLANHPKDQRRVYACVHPRDVVRYEPRPATTRYRVVRRAHFGAIGHPLAGDELYGGLGIRALGRHALHAARITYSGGAVVPAFDVEVSLPKDMTSLLEWNE